MTESFTVTEPRHEERNLVADSWRRSLQRSPAFSAMPSRGYVYTLTETIQHFLGRDYHRIELLDDDFMLMARDEERPAYVLGWLLGRDMKPGLALIYVYVKRDHRGEGIAKELLASALERCEEGELWYCYRTRFDGLFEKYGMQYLPVQKLEFQPAKVAQ